MDDNESVDKEATRGNDKRHIVIWASISMENPEELIIRDENGEKKIIINIY